MGGSLPHARFVEQKLPMLRVVPSQATYLLWLDCSAVAEDAGAHLGHRGKRHILTSRIRQITVDLI